MRSSENKKTGQWEYWRIGKFGPLYHHSIIPFFQNDSLCSACLGAGTFLLVLFLVVSGCAGKRETVKPPSQSMIQKFPIVVYPVENLSGTRAPLQEIREEFIERLKEKGFEVLGGEALEKFMARNRIRYTGGLDSATSKAFQEQIGIQGVLMTSIASYSEEIPPKMALISRLVSTGSEATISWIDGIGLSGDDSPGLLGLGLVEDPEVLMKRAVQSLAHSLAVHISNHEAGRDVVKVKKRYRPKIAFRSPQLEMGKKYTIAIVPFFNVSGRKYAGEILVLQFVKQFKEFENFEVIEPGLVRQELLNARIIMEDSISIAQAEILFGILNVDLILAGKVMDYQDYIGTWGKAKVDFSSQLIERQSRQVVWSSRSYNDGEEAVYFFDLGKVNTSHVLTDRMVGAIGEMVIRGIPEEVPREEEPILPAIWY